MNKTFFLVVTILSLTTQATAQLNSNDTVESNMMQEVSIKARFLNDTDRYRYNQKKFYVTTVLPYVNAASALFKEVQAKADDPNVSRKEYKRFIKSKEEVMKTQFEDQIRRLNVTQGELLVKLIARQTNLNLYKMIQEVKNPIVAIKWQSWALVNGMNLDKKYHPEDEKDLENIMYELGYPLPDSYATR